MCKKIIVKPNGIIYGGNWYCSQACKDQINDGMDDSGELEKWVEDYTDPVETEELDDDPDIGQEADLNFDELIN